MDQLDQLEASESEHSFDDNSFSDTRSNSSLGADIIPPQSRSPSPSPSPNPGLLSELSTTSKTGVRHSIGARIQALTYLELETPIFQIEAKTGVGKAQIYNIRKKALARGWDPTISTIIEPHHIDDSFRSGRSKVS